MKIEKEIWKDIEGYEGLYQISNLGRVKSLKRTRLSSRHSICSVKERILKPNIGKREYPYVALYKNGISKTLKIHRLVAFAFVENIDPTKRTVVDHVNNVKTDNRSTNLEWVTISINTQRSFNEGCQVVPEGKDHHLSKSVQQINKINGSIINVFGSLNEAERNTGVDNSSISRVCRGIQKTAGNYLWRYADE